LYYEGEQTNEDEMGVLKTWKERKAYEGLVGQPERKTPLGIPKYETKFNVKITQK
jgi:hypothetical protein